MFDTPADENPYPTSQASMVIRPRALIRYLGGSIGVLISLPTLIFFFMLVSDPAGLFADLDWTILFFVVQQIASIWLTYRWFSIRAEFDEEKVCLRGLIRTLKFKVSDFSDIRKFHYQTYSENLGNHQSWKYVVYDRHQEQLGNVPASMQFCKDWPEFHKRVNRLSKL